MKKVIKRIIVCLVIAFCSVVLVGCQMGGSGNEGGGNNGDNGGSGNSGQNQGNKTVAKLDASKQGTYSGDDVTVVIRESTVAITDPTGKTLEYTIYEENGTYYIEEEGEKVVCTFGDGTVTNKHGTFSKDGGNGGQGQSNKTVAKLDASKQGTYSGDGVTVVVRESSVAVTDPSGKTLEYTIYVENGTYFIEEEGQKIVCTFGDGTVTNKHGTFSKNGGNGGQGQGTTDTPASIDASLQGEYFFGGVKVVVSASKVLVIDPTGMSQEYNLYQENGKIYFYEEGQKVYCTFGDGTVTNKYGTFTRDGSSTSGLSADEAARKFAGFLEFNESFRIPNGDAIADITSNEEETTTYVITISNPSETYAAYKAYFDDFFSKLGYTESQTAWVKLEGLTKGRGAGIEYDAKTNTLAVMASKFDMGSGTPDGMDLAGFVNKFKELSDVELKFPTSITEITDVVYREEDGDAYLAGSFTYGEASDASNAFNELVLAFDAAITAKGYEKGEIESSTYSNLVSYSVQWLKPNDYTSISLELLSYSGYNDCSLSYYGPIGGGNNQGNVDSWPSDQIASYFANKVNIPVYNGTFETISVSVLNQDGGTTLQVNMTGAMEKDFNLWIEALKNAGFIENESTWFIKYLEGNGVAEVYAYISSGFASFTFKASEREITPWPSNLIEEKYSKAVLDAIPVPDKSGNTSYASNYALGMLQISVDSGLQTDLYEKYQAALLQAGFVNVSGGSYEYTFENNDVIELQLYRPSYALNRFSLTIEFEEYTGMEYIIPTNFSAQINGFNLVKIGESYVYTYSYNNTTKMVETYLYDEAKGQWLHASGNIMTYATGNNPRAVWQNFGTDTDPVYYQYVSRPQLDEYLNGTNGLAYYYYEEYLDATDPIRDSSKNATIAGVACEYVKIVKDNSIAGYSVINTTELWIDPVSHMIFKVIASASVNGQTTTNGEAFLIKSFDTTVTSFAQAGIANCMLPTFDASHATDNDHLYGEIVDVPATCGKDGEKYQVCTCCGEKKVLEHYAATGNHTPEMNGNEPYYFSDYNGHHSKLCTECHEYYDEEDCTFGEWTVVQPATCSREGVRTHQCSKCGDTVRETIPVDPNAHNYTGGYYGNNITLVLPTFEAAGSITWTCIEECGASETVALPVINDQNYIVGVYNDYNTGKNYKLYAFDMAALVKQINDTLKPATPIDEFYITGTVFSGNQLTYNYDYDNPLYGFLGDEIADPLASVAQSYRGELFDYENNKLVLGENSFTLTQGEETLSFTLYSDNDGIYFRNSYEEKEYISLYDDGTVMLGNFGDFAKRVIAHLDKDLQGEYTSEDGHTVVIVSESKVVVTIQQKSYEYDVYDEDGSYFIIDNNEKVYCEFGDGYVSNDFGTFYKPEDNGEEGGEEGGEEDQNGFPFDVVSEFLGTEDYAYATYDDAEYSVNDETEGVLIVEVTLPEGVNSEEAAAEMISWISGYDAEAGYYADLDAGYVLQIEAMSENQVSLVYAAQ